jgi:ubiquinone/menaquinone biosynthesis C-methylase UbiE
MSRPVATPSFKTHAGSAAEGYERYFVPVIGAPLAKRLVEAAAVKAGERVLDVACGTGVVARLAAERVGATGRVTGLDANPGMLAVARSVSASSVIEWCEAQAESTPLPDAIYDAVLSQLGLQFFGDRQTALAEMHRVLRPGGRLVANLPGPPPQLFEVMERSLAEHAPGADRFVRAVFSLHSRPEIEQLLTGAGFADVSVTSESRSLPLPAPEEFLWQYVSSTPLASAIGAMGDPEREALRADVTGQWENLMTEGELILELDVITMAARKRDHAIPD